MKDEVPCRSVATSWLVRHLHNPDVRVLEASSTSCIYKNGHIPGAQYLDWHADDPGACDNFDDAFELLQIEPETLIVLYGDDNNRHAKAACALIQRCHPNVRILEGGRARWIAEGRTLSREIVRYPSCRHEEILADLNPVAAYKDIV